jgi:signal transduction histidine kinase
MLCVLRKCCSVIGLGLLMTAAHAQSAREQSLTEMDHKKWTARDGAPQGITALAQGADGTLWIGSDSGLYTFDGRTFTLFQATAGETEIPVEPVGTLLAARDGTLWAGFFQAGVAHIKQGRVTLYPKVAEGRMSLTTHLREARDGSIWMTQAQRRILRFGPKQGWHEEPQPLAGGERLHAILDSSDTLWVAQGGRLFRRDIREPGYVEASAPVDWMFGLTEEPDATIWIADFDATGSKARLQHIDRSGSLITRLRGVDEWAPRQVIYRPDGALLYASQFDGLRLFSRDLLSGKAGPARNSGPETFTELHGLSSDALYTILRDADGTLWAGGHAGLDRFKTGSFTPFVTEQKAGQWNVCANGRGEVWVLHETNRLYKVVNGTTKELALPEKPASITCGRDGHTWLVNRTGAWSVHDDRVTAMPPIPGVPLYGLDTIVATSDHTLFAMVGGNASAGGGIWQYRQGQWTKFSGPGLLAFSGIVAYVDRQDRLWTGLRDQVGRPTPTGGELIDAPGLGLVYALLETRRGFFAAGTNGLAVLRGSRFAMLEFENRALMRGLSGLVEARNGDLWLNTPRGIARVPANELQAALATPHHRMKSELVTEGEFAGLTVTINSVASAARDNDGNLWFATRTGVFRLDPEHRGSDIRPPILSIRSIEADRVALGADRTFAPRPQTLEIRYFGVHLTDPERVTYRYRLAGLEDSWQDAGQRTEAFYTRLAPGTYTFHVMASSGNDVWTKAILSQPFVVLPSFYQTAWFRVLAVTVGLALIFAIFTLRVRAITRTIRARAEERADERIHIARELHDTLLQGIQGLLLNFHVAAQKMAAEDASKAMLERTLATADRIIVEGRNRVSSLRSEHLTDGELVASIENAGNDLRCDSDVQFSVQRAGSDVTLDPHVADEIFWIAREALTNAFRHAGASRISVELDYGARYFGMVCVDNGRGFDANSPEKHGHWGLQGMTERARKIGGQLRLTSDRACGTQIVVSVPSYRAYRNNSRLMFHLRASWAVFRPASS